ncbi:MAG: DUF3786 domain-containing protein [Thermodesulfovibrionales bacterium]|nr:DUF3786 domain-containing protein [Thermodesulfovibrionales bacterium]
MTEEIVPIKIVHGEAKSWEGLSAMDPDEVCRRAGVRYDASSATYHVLSFGVEFLVIPEKKRIDCPSEEGCLFLKKLKDFFRLSVLWYLTSANHIDPTGRYLRPVDVKGGHRFSAGTHVLPLDRIAGRFGRDPDGFKATGEEYGADIVEGYGDAAIRLYPLPRVPVTLVLWLEDEEEDFPPRVDLFFDSTIDFQISLSDIVWAVAIMSALVMLED